MKIKSDKKKKIKAYIRPAERQDIVYLINWLQSDDYKNNYLTDYPLKDKKQLKDILLREITLSKFITSKKEILVAEVDGERLAGMIFLSHIDWKNRHLDLQIYFPPEYRTARLNLDKGQMTTVKERDFDILETNGEFLTLFDYRSKYERAYLQMLIQESKGNREVACRMSGISQSRLYGLLKKHNLSFISS